MTPHAQDSFDLLNAQRNASDANRIGRYRKVALLGQGGLGEVYLAECTDLVSMPDDQRYVALKVPRPDVLGYRTVQPSGTGQRPSVRQTR